MKYSRMDANTIYGVTMRYLSEDGSVRIECDKRGIHVGMTRPLTMDELAKFSTSVDMAKVQYASILATGKLASEGFLLGRVIAALESYVNELREHTRSKGGAS